MLVPQVVLNTRRRSTEGACQGLEALSYRIRPQSHRLLHLVSSILTILVRKSRTQPGLGAPMASGGDPLRGGHPSKAAASYAHEFPFKFQQNE